MGRKICTECNTVFEDKVLIDKNSENCLVCGASLRDMDEPQLAPEENDNSLITWYYYCTGRGFYLSDEPLEGYRLEYKFKAPKDLDKAKEILRKEYDSTAFATPSVSTLSLIHI